MILQAVIIFFREADWLTAERARIYGRLIALGLLLCVAAVGWRLVASTGQDPRARPILTDFVAFWAAGDMARQGRADQVYDVAATTAVERRIVQLKPQDYLPYLNPPVFLLLCTLLAALPYFAAMAAFILGSSAAALLCLWRILPRRWALVPILGFPGTALNAMIGQNGALTCCCFAGATLALERWPLVAGASLGLLAYKPHLAAAVPVALLAARRWRAFFAAGATAACLCALSWLVFGGGTWRGFLHAPAVILGELAQQPNFWGKSVSVFGAVRVLYGGAGLAATAQAASAAAALGALAWAVRRRPGAGVEISAALVATLLCTPHAMDYDLACLAVPLAWLAGNAVRTGWRPWEKSLLAALYMVPLLARGLSVYAHVPLTPFLLAGLLACLCARARRPCSLPVAAPA